MKKSFFYLTFCFLLIAGSANASFPIEKEAKTTKTEQSESTDNAVSELQTSLDLAQENDSSISELPSEEDLLRMSDEEFWITLALCVLLGGVAAHRWYAGKPVGWNILFILTGGGCGIWWLVDLINILTRKF